jgi:hypothetical protein
MSSTEWASSSINTLQANLAAKNRAVISCVLSERPVQGNNNIGIGTILDNIGRQKGI